MNDCIQALTLDALSAATAAASPVVITLPATADKYWVIPGLVYSYDSLPGVTGGIVISDGVKLARLGR